MNEDTVARALGALRAARMSEAASDRVHDELERAWRDRAARPRRRAFVVPSFARSMAVAALVVAVAFVTVKSSADSPLYAFRVAIEDALVAVQADPVAYTTDLYDQRLEEAAQFEAVGNALAASRAREATDDALRLLNQVAPKQSDEPQPSPSASTVIFVPSMSPTAEPTATPTTAPTALPTPTPTGRPTTRPTPTPTAKPTATKPATPTPYQIVHVTGGVLYPDGTPVDGACVSTALTGSCITKSVSGTVDLRFPAKNGQTITLYFQKVDTLRGTLRGTAQAIVTGPTLQLGAITLKPAV